MFGVSLIPISLAFMTVFMNFPEVLHANEHEKKLDMKLKLSTKSSTSVLKLIQFTFTVKFFPCFEVKANLFDSTCISIRLQNNSDLSNMKCLN